MNQKLKPFEHQNIVAIRETQHPRIQTNINHALGYSESFEWGYHGTGPIDFALNILFHFTNGDHDFASRYRNQFTIDFIGKLPKNGGVMKVANVLNWIKEKRELEEKIKSKPELPFAPVMNLSIYQQFKKRSTA